MSQYTSCPECGDKWTKEEIELQECFMCGWPIEDEVNTDKEIEIEHEPEDFDDL